MNFGWRLLSSLLPGKHVSQPKLGGAWSGRRPLDPGSFPLMSNSPSRPSHRRFLSRLLSDRPANHTTKESNMSDSPITKGVHHVGLTVPNLDAAQAFFVDVLALEKVGEKPDYPAVFLSDGTTMITLWQAKDPARAVPFDRHQVIGLHHLAMTVDGEKNLRKLHRALERRDDTDIEFAPEPLGDGPTQHMMCFIPGGIRLEFIAPAA